jgi:hypothetical protein
MHVTMDYVDQRYAQFAEKYRAALAYLKFSEQDIAERVKALQHRLATHDFKRYGDKPIHFLHAGKRITRFLIKHAIEYSPAARARRTQLQADYHARIAQERLRQPLATFFSFEAAYARKLKINLANFRSLFRL